MLLATCGRVNSHRFAFALAAGVFAAFAVPAVFSGLMPSRWPWFRLPRFLPFRLSASRCRSLHCG